MEYVRLSARLKGRGCNSSSSSKGADREYEASKHCGHNCGASGWSWGLLIEDRHHVDTGTAWGSWRQLLTSNESSHGNSFEGADPAYFNCRLAALLICVRAVVIERAGAKTLSSGHGVAGESSKCSISAHRSRCWHEDMRDASIHETRS